MLLLIIDTSQPRYKPNQSAAISAAQHGVERKSAQMTLRPRTARLDVKLLTMRVGKKTTPLYKWLHTMSALPGSKMARCKC